MSSFGGCDSLSQTSLFARFPLFPTSNSATSGGSGLSYLLTLSHDANAQAVERTRSVWHRLRCASSIYHQHTTLNLISNRNPEPPSRVVRPNKSSPDNWRLTVRLEIRINLSAMCGAHCQTVSVFFQSHRLQGIRSAIRAEKNASTFYRLDHNAESRFCRGSGCFPDERGDLLKRVSSCHSIGQPSATVGTDVEARAKGSPRIAIRKSSGARQDTRRAIGVRGGATGRGASAKMVRFGTLTTTTLSHPVPDGFPPHSPSLTSPTLILLRCLPTIANASSMQWSRVMAAAILTGVRTQPRHRSEG